jgi:type II secretory pathway pseudopilin PulG
MVETLVVLIIVGILGIIVLFLRYNFGDPFDTCGRRVYADD